MKMQFEALLDQLLAAWDETLAVDEFAETYWFFQDLVELSDGLEKLTDRVYEVIAKRMHRARAEHEKRNGRR